MAGKLFRWIVYCLAVMLLGLVVYQIPAVKTRLEWRLDAAVSFVRGVVYSPERAPTPLPPPATPTVLASPTLSATPAPSPTPTPGPTATPIPSPTPLPAQVLLDPPAWEKQDWNNCGPATLALYLRWFGWEGDQFTISSLIKPKRRDRNVNVEELVWYARNHAGWLNTEFRVGGNIDLLKRYLALGMPIMIEEGTLLDQAYWPTDDKWAGHYLLLTGYDDATQTFIAQDTYKGADLRVSYARLDENWKAFNRVYIMVYPPQREAEVRALLGDDWDVDVNRQHALEQARAETEANPEDAFAWFNLGSNLVYFEKYQDAALAYDTARQLGLPQRMFRYQFGPFIAYFHAFRLDDLMALTEYALKLTANSEEAMLWRGWGFYRLGERQQALEMFYQALEANPTYQDARYAIDFVLNN